jgi:NAD(P)-dependent dehydrogenase (short-subunit alcohol dehydrogenase family)
MKTANSDGKTLWVTGASSGIGLAIAQKLVAEGHFVLGSSRNAERLAQLATQLGPRFQPLPADIGDALALPDVNQRLTGLTDYLDGVIACAGICEYEDDLDFDPARYARTFNTNFLGVVHCLHLAKPLLLKSQQSPRFVAVGSLSSALPFPRAEAYGASKAALEYFIKSAAIDLASSRLRVQLIRPGFVKTPLTQGNDFPMPWMMTPEAAAEAIFKALQSDALCVDFPRRLSWLLRSLAAVERLWIGYAGRALSRQAKH